VIGLANISYWYNTENQSDFVCNSLSIFVVLEHTALQDVLSQSFQPLNENLCRKVVLEKEM